MAIKCSLLGHDFGEPSVEREREEQGSEVVITIREIETCARCGERKVVSENKEVTTLETPEDVEAVGHEPPEGTASEPEPDDGSESEPAPEPTPEPAADEAEIVDGDDGNESADEQESEPEPPVTEAESEPEEPPVTDDAEILDDEDDEPEREPGEWPQEADEGPSHDEEEEDFDQYGYMEDVEDTVDEDATDAEFIDGDPEPAEVPGSQTNAWPSEDDSDEERTPTGPGAVTVPEGKFVCEKCGFSTPVEASSLREGDFCPECHQETLVQVREP